VQCPTGDIVLDDPSARKALDSAWTLSNPTAQPTSNRIEIGLAIFDSAGTTVFRIYPSAPNDGPCQNDLPVVPPFPGTLIAVAHTHPAKVGQRIQCTATRNIVYANQYGGPSYADWQRSTLNGPTVPSYVIDADRIYRMLGYPTSANYWEAAVDPQGNPILDSSGNQLYLPKGSLWRNFYTNIRRNQGSCSVV
jgi:hypothetical protein